MPGNPPRALNTHDSADENSMPRADSWARKFAWLACGTALLALGASMAFRHHALAGSGDRVSAARARAGKRVADLCAAAGLAYPPRELFLRGFKEEKILEAWGRDGDGPYKLITAWPVLAASGGPGPKRKQGDFQVPEGVYKIVAWNPKSNFHLSIGLDYPNASDKVRSDRKNPGQHIYFHGGTASIGCFAIGDDKAEEMFLLAKDVKVRAIPVHLFPARMAGEAWQKLHAEHEALHAFWGELQPVFDAFEKTKKVPKVKVERDGAYRVER